MGYSEIQRDGPWDAAKRVTAEDSGAQHDSGAAVQPSASGDAAASTSEQRTPTMLSHETRRSPEAWVAAILESFQGLHGEPFARFARALDRHRLVLMRDKFSAHYLRSLALPAPDD